MIALPGVQANVGPMKFVLNIAGGVAGYKVWEKYLATVNLGPLASVPFAREAVMVAAVFAGAMVGNMIASKVA